MPMGTRVRVINTFQRRAQIDKPVEGWCSIESRAGDIILSPLEDDEKDLVTPNWASSTKSKAELLREKLDRMKERQKNAQLQIDEAKRNSEIRNLAEQMTNLQEVILNKRAPDTSTSGSIKAKLLHARSCVSRLEIENCEKKLELASLQNKLGMLQDKLDQVCEERGLCNPLEVSNQIELLEGEQVKAKQRMREYQVANERYKKEISSLKRIMTNLLNKESSRLLPDNEKLDEGDVVLMKGNVGIVIVQYIGRVHWDKDNVYIGVELSGPTGNCNGTVDGESYFSAPPNHGAFYPLKEVDRKIPPAFLLKQLQKQVHQNNLLSTCRE